MVWLFMTRAGELHLGRSETPAGALQIYETLLREDEEYEVYRDLMNADKRDLDANGQPMDEDRAYFSEDWRTWQLSDHLPLWVELGIDFSDQYLRVLTA